MSDGPRVISIGASAQEATLSFHTFDDQEPDLISTGFPPLDRKIGGLFPGTSMVLAGKTGVGKSSLMLTQAFTAANSGTRVGVISLEDTPDVLGSRSIAALSGVDSLAIRTKRLSPTDKRRIMEAEEKLLATAIDTCYPIGLGVPGVVAAVEKLGKNGCRLIFIDYLQKIRGGVEDRRNEIGQAFSAVQAACYNAKAAAVFVSQVSRPIDHNRALTIHSIKESGDVENEARVIVLVEREEASPRLTARVAKCTFGGEGLTWSLQRDPSGTLREVTGNYGEF